MRKKMLIFTVLFLTSSTSYSFASWDKKPQFRWEQLYRYDLRRNNHRFYINRLSTIFNYLDSKKDSIFKVMPFFEMRRNIDQDLWERKELGIEIGKDIFPWVYFGEVIQEVWVQEDSRDYRDYEKRNYAESETRLLISHSLLSNEHIKLKGFILNEYTYDFDRGAGTRNEVVAGFIMPVGKYIETAINGRHIDRIHYYDADTLEASVTLVF